MKSSKGKNSKEATKEKVSPESRENFELEKLNLQK
jgi:hypothetical protein